MYVKVLPNNANMLSLGNHRVAADMWAGETTATLASYGISLPGDAAVSLNLISSCVKSDCMKGTWTMKWIEAVKPKSISKTTWKVTDLRSLQSIKGDEVVCST